MLNVVKKIACGLAGVTLIGLPIVAFAGVSLYLAPVVGAAFAFVVMLFASGGES